MFSIKEFVVKGWTPMLVGFPLAVSAFATANTAWVAKPTGNLKCQVQTSTLDPAVTGLSSQNIVVDKAMVGTINDGRMTCNRCGICAEGDYNIAEIEDVNGAVDTAKHQGWEPIDSQKIGSPQNVAAQDVEDNQ